MRKLNDQEKKLLEQIRNTGMSEEDFNNLPVMWHRKHGIRGVAKTPADMEKVKDVAKKKNKMLGVENYFVCTMEEYLN